MTDEIYLVIDFEAPRVFGKPFGKRIQWEYPSSGTNIEELIKLAEKNNPSIKKNVVQYINKNTGETIKGPKYDTTTMEVDPRFKVKLDVPQQKPMEPSQYEPRDRFQENTNMSEIKKFKNLVRECISEIKQENNPQYRLKESLRSMVKGVLNEFTTKNIPEQTKEEKEISDKQYNKDNNTRLDKTNTKQQEELETLVHAIDPTWDVYWDDHLQLIVRAQNLLYVRICPQYEDKYNVDAMVKLVDRVRAIALTWDQVKAFVKANFSDLKNSTNADNLHKKAIDDENEDKQVKTKEAGPLTGVIKNRGEKKNGQDAKIKNTKKDDKDYNEPMTKKDEDMPDQPMKQVTEPGKDPEGLNHNIKKTGKVPYKYPKNKKASKSAGTKTPKFVEKQLKAS